MLIGKVCTVCGMTKKAVEYYEAQGLISPAQFQNGYRDYSDDDAARLKEIALLRKLDISIADIRIIVRSEDKCGALADYQAKRKLALDQAGAQYDCIAKLIASGYDIERIADDVAHALDGNRRICDRLLCAFPGNFGRFLGIHFGRFLNEPIDTPKKAIAYQRIVAYLDTVEAHTFPAGVAAFFEMMDEQNCDDFEAIAHATTPVLDNFDDYLEENRGFIEQYLAFRNSESYKSSPLFAMQQAMMAFQQSSGYHDIFLHNMKIVSAAYREHMRKLCAANDSFLAHYPQSNTLYDE